MEPTPHVRKARRKDTRTEEERYVLAKAKKEAKAQLESTVPAPREKKVYVRKKTCKGINMAGNPCRSVPLRKGTLIEGEEASGEYCLFHDAGLPASGWRSFVQKGADVTAAGARVKPYEIAARAMELAPKYLLAPYLEALGLMIDDDTGELKPDPDNPVGLRYFGFDKSGRVRMSPHANLEAQVRIAEKLADRFYGKARTATEMAGGSGGSIHIEIPQDMGRARVVASVLFEAGAIQPQDSPLENVIDGTAEDLES